MKYNVKEIFSIAVRLLIICTVVAVIIAAVNLITKDRIAYNEMLSTAEAMSGIYRDDFFKKDFTVENEKFVIKEKDTVLIELNKADFAFTSKDVKELYVITDYAGEIHGYCVSVHPMGFKDYIKMLVAVNPDCTVKGVEIVSMSETSGIGTKAKEPSFLSSFKSLNDVEVLRNVDVISGATKTTKPIINAVSESLNEVADYIRMNGGADK